MAMDYARNTHQELIMVQLDLVKAYNHVNWSFVSRLMHKMGFGPRMSRLIFLLGQDAVSRVMLNGGVTSDICRIPMYNGRIHTIPFDCPSSGHLCK